MRGQGRLYQQNGSAVYWMRFYMDGKEIRESTHERDEQKAAKILAERIKDKHAAERGGPALITNAHKRQTVGDLLDTLKDNFELRGIYSAGNRSTINSGKEGFGDVLAVAFGPAHVKAYIRKRRAEQKANATINRTLTVVGQAFGLAIREGAPFKQPYIEHLSEADNVRTQSCAREQFDIIREHLPEDPQVGDYIVATQASPDPCIWRKGDELQYVPAPNSGDSTYVDFEVLSEEIRQK